MTSKSLLYISILFAMLFLFVGCTDDSAPDEEGEPTPMSLERPDAASMDLPGAPPPQPTDHVDRWDPELRQDSCLVCHNNPATGAKELPADHYYNEEVGGVIFRDNCVQCHAEQIDDKPGFNRDN
ncbi:Nitrate reductase cytochrome c-type subunit (NapB) [Evansella caseinilytica]|uniref:Nitrate reductase cytochrome c-type subunit (NapB) n=1 Tax=Evansella caseinilytica TaxID=1503961 RepID=A0A1H3SHA8_9BACI|nr:nitrate reductase cytochrome c-type subunit [Evansella caseinilytica]SDZ37396.1 Nitrate reductase cytochrome c-type subunit (NapB) [Evansella caseinilytica]